MSYRQSQYLYEDTEVHCREMKEAAGESKQAKWRWIPSHLKIKQHCADDANGCGYRFLQHHGIGCRTRLGGCGHNRDRRRQERTKWRYLGSPTALGPRHYWYRSEPLVILAQERFGCNCHRKSLSIKSFRRETNEAKSQDTKKF